MRSQSTVLVYLLLLLRDDISLLALYPSFLETFMNICHKHGIKWRYAFNHTKSGVVTFGETKPLHPKSMKEHEWMLGDAIVNELYEYKNLGVLKNYVNSFASNAEDNIEKARKKGQHDFLLLTLIVV